MSQLNFDACALRLHEDDDVAVLRVPVQPGDELVDGPVRVTVRGAIAEGHKIALADLPAGRPVRKYGQVIGFATTDIRAGDHVHTHNLEVRDFGRDYRFCEDARPLALYPPQQQRTFMGYARREGRAATRNYVAILSSVNCSATVARAVAERFRTPEFRRDFPHVDGVVAFTHKTGCCLQPGEPEQLVQRVLLGFARHPNIFGSVLIGLGCEGLQVSGLRELGRLDVPRPGLPAPVLLNVQESGGSARTVETAVAEVKRLLSLAETQRRSPQPLSHLCLAMNCGGSDGLSGITANPALGVASDELLRHGGTSVLAETPEIYGAEHLLTRRALTLETGRRLVDIIHWWEEHVRLHHASINNNPTPGNKAGGLTTIYEKSLGAVAKGGQAPLAAVYGYAEPVTARGLCFMDTPGFDPVSMTGLVAGGCNVAAFTTGRGSVYGCKPAPCVKIASSSALYARMTDDMDVNAGVIMDGREPVREVGLRIFEMLVAAASGAPTKSEALGAGDEEFAPWILGPTL